jgi:hypothetical protein
MYVDFSKYDYAYVHSYDVIKYLERHPYGMFFYNNIEFIRDLYFISAT